MLGYTNIAHLTDRKNEVIAMAEEKKEPQAKGKGNVFDKDMPAGMTKVFGKVGAKSWFDLLVMVAGILCIISVIVQLGLGYATNGWRIVYYIILLWVYVDAALYIKLGPFFASKFKSVTSALSFLRDENDAKNFMVIIGAWTAVLDTLSNAWVVSPLSGGLITVVFWIYVPAIVIYGFFLLKGFMSKK